MNVAGGTAHIFRDEPRVFTFLMHGERNYPLRKERSNLDIGLPDGLTDLPYLDISRAGCRERDRRVLALCRQHQLPVAVSMGGGYSPRIADIVEASPCQHVPGGAGGILLRLGI